jgi:hypothetical protein
MTVEIHADGEVNGIYSAILAKDSIKRHGATDHGVFDAGFAKNVFNVKWVDSIHRLPSADETLPDKVIKIGSYAKSSRNLASDFLAGD